VLGSEFSTKAAHYIGDSEEIAARLNLNFCDLMRAWLVQPSPLKRNFSLAVESSCEISHMQRSRPSLNDDLSL
jgi:hypothetical protein